MNHTESSALPALGRADDWRRVQAARMPDYTYRLSADRRRISGSAEGLDAVRQAVDLMLHTERYQYPIYSFRYGVELQDLIGRPVDYAMSEIKRRVTEALLQDDRIQQVSDWSFQVEGSCVTASFVVHSVYGAETATVQAPL